MTDPVTAPVPTLAERLQQLVDKWNTDAETVGVMGYYQQANRIDDCRKELLALLAALTPEPVRPTPVLDVRLAAHEHRIAHLVAENARLEELANDRGNEVALLLQWQPIETAPKDGREVLLTNGKYKRTAFWARLRGVWSVDSVVGLPEATHWLPLPPEDRR